MNSNTSSENKRAESNDKTGLGGSSKKSNSSSKGPGSARSFGKAFTIKSIKIFGIPKARSETASKKIRKREKITGKTICARLRKKKIHGGLSRSKRRMLKEIKRGLP